MRTIPLALLLTSLLASAPALAAQDSAGAEPPPLDGPHRAFRDSTLDRIVGTWRMRGQVGGDSVTYDATAGWVLNHQFLRVELTDAINRPPEYQAAVYIGYDHASERYVAHWMDVFGGRASETLGFGQRADGGIRFVFEYPEGPFHTTFAPAADGWSLTMRTRGRDGRWRTFGAAVARRAP
jgi:hypothetical protein